MRAFHGRSVPVDGVPATAAFGNFRRRPFQIRTPQRLPERVIPKGRVMLGHKVSRMVLILIDLRLEQDLTGWAWIDIPIEIDVKRFPGMDALTRAPLKTGKERSMFDG